MSYKIAWLVPFPLKGSGGHRTIFSHINNLVELGHTCHIYIEGEELLNLADKDLPDLVEKYFGTCAADIYPGHQVRGKYDLAVATAWWTAPVVAHQVEASRKAYFIQDFEPFFNPMGDNYILAENTYRLGLIPITIGRFLSHLMSVRFNTPSYYYDFTANKNIYHPLSDAEKERSVCFVYQPEKPRRCPGIGKEALAIVKHHCPDVTIYTYGTKAPPDFWFDHTHLGMLSLKECNRLYNRCSVGLCLSSSNPSRIPFEMMAAGLPAVDFYGENTRYDLPVDGILLAEKNASSVAGAIIRLLNDAEQRQAVSTAGQRFMQKKGSELEYQQCAAIIEAILSDKLSAGPELRPKYTAPPHRDTLPGVPGPPPPSQTPPSAHHGAAWWLRNNRIARTLKVLFRGYY